MASTRVSIVSTAAILAAINAVDSSLPPISQLSDQTTIRLNQESFVGPAQMRPDTADSLLDAQIKELRELLAVRRKEVLQQEAALLTRLDALKESERNVLLETLALNGDYSRFEQVTAERYKKLFDQVSSLEAETNKQAERIDALNGKSQNLRDQVDAVCIDSKKLAKELSVEQERALSLDKLSRDKTNQIMALRAEAEYYRDHNRIMEFDWW